MTIKSHRISTVKQQHCPIQTNRDFLGCLLFKTWLASIVCIAIGLGSVDHTPSISNHFEDPF